MGWQKPKPPGAGPWGWWPAERPKPQWASRTADNMPSVGPSGRALVRGAFGDRRAEAYARMCDDLSNRWRTHKR
jgi:hypothetical protein